MNYLLSLNHNHQSSGIQIEVRACYQNGHRYYNETGNLIAEVKQCAFDDGHYDTGWILEHYIPFKEMVILRGKKLNKYQWKCFKRGECPK